MRRTLTTLLFFALFLALGLSGCGNDSSPSGTDRPAPTRSDAATPSTEARAAEGLARGAPVIWISVDTVRSDRLPAYGYDAGSTPHIDSLVADGVLFERAWSPVPLTLPAHVSLFTGLLPSGHGVRDNVGYAVRLDLGADLLGRLRGLGYRTGAAVSAYPLSRQVGFAEDSQADGSTATFDFFDDAHFRPELGYEGLERSGDTTLDASLPWLREVAASGEPFFFFFHLYEPHAPYEPPPPFDERFDDAYDGEIAAADAIVGRLLDALRAAGVYERALVVLFSDHGEGLGEHGEEEHGLLLYREALQIPLVVKLPGARHAGERVARSVQITDLAPTVLDVVGGEIPAGLGGVSLLPVIRDADALDVDRPIYAETFYPRIHLGWSELLSVVRSDDHYVEAPAVEPPAPELYDLAEDPDQRRNLFTATNPPSDLRRRLGEARRALREYDPRFEPPGEASDEERAALASLGYLAGAADDAEGPLPDPRTRVGVFESLKAGNLAYDAGDFEIAARLYRQTVEADPTMISAWTDLARSLARLGRFDEAVEPYRQAVLRADEPVDAARELLGLLQHLDRPTDALPVLDTALGRHPGEVRLLFLKAQVLMSQRRFDEALAVSEQALALAPDLPDAHYLRGTVQIGRGELAAADRDLQAALGLDASHVAALSDLAILRIRQGRLEDGRDFLRRVLALRPEDELARRNLERVEERLAAESPGAGR